MLTLVGCSTNKADTKTQLEGLRKEQAALSKEIKTLEDALSAENTKKGVVEGKIVRTTPIALQSFKSFIEVQGKVSSKQNVGVTPRMAGAITSVLVSEGSRVSKGQVLATLDDQVMRQGVQELETAMDLANTMFQKQDNLWKQNIGTEMQYLQAKNNKQSMERRMATMKEQLAMTRITAPISGTVDKVLVKIGEMAAPGFPAFDVVNLADMSIMADVGESYINKLKVGGNVQINFPDFNQTIQGRIHFVSKSIDVLNRTCKIEVKVPPTTNGFRLAPNMVANLKIEEFSQKDAVVVPINIIQKDDKGQFLFVVTKKGTQAYAEKRSITTGKISAGMALVASGLGVGEEIISVGSSELNGGEKIAVQK